MSIEITAVPGDCPQTFRSVQQLLAAAGADFSWDEPSEGATHLDMLRSAQRTKLALVGHARAKEASELPPAVVLRDELNIFAQHRPIRPMPGLPSRHDDADLIVVRETTEDVYAHLEHESIPGVFESLKITTRAACERIARHAMDTARATGRTKVTIVHKANIMKLSDGMFLRVAREVAQDYPDLEVDDCIVDALCMKLVIWPSQFEVLLCGNLFGDIVGDLCAGLVGGRSNAPSVNFGTDGLALFTAGQGDHPDVCGTEQANPLPLLLPAIHLLRHTDQGNAADRLEEAIGATLEHGIRPFGLGGDASRSDFCDEVASRL